MTTKYQRATFSLSGEGCFEGWHNPEYTWNGFAVPCFAMNEVEDIATLVERMNTTDQPCWVLPLADGLVVVQETDDDGWTFETRCPTVEVGGDIAYFVGDGWCWEVAQ